MLLDQETLRFIFGLKLRNLRQNAGLSLKDLAKKAGLSPSYINEIEKGKKYPKGEKVLQLAQSLGVSYEDLISLKLEKEMSLLSKVLEKNLLSGLPFDVFGIPARTLFEIMADRPRAFNAFVGTLIELARIYNIKVEDFFEATLRAFLDMNHNYFPELEEKVFSFCNAHDLKTTDGSLSDFLTANHLIQFLEKEYNYEVLVKSFKELNPHLKDLYVFITGEKSNRLYLNKELSEREKVFLLSREIANCWLDLKERLKTYPTVSVDSYEQLDNNFKASYFASALIIPRRSFVNEMKSFFGQKSWHNDHFKKLIETYPGTVDSFFHRLTQILPSFLKMDQIFFLKCEYDQKKDSYSLQRELHLAELHSPHGVKTIGHYCRRWITTSLMQQLIEAKEDFIVGVQKSSFFETDNEYICFSAAYSHELDKSRNVCVTIGIAIDKQTSKKMSFVNDPDIPKKIVADTCEACGIKDCEVRAADPIKIDRDKKEVDINAIIETL